MRIISGKARGTKLYTLEGKNTRPTLDRVKESIFNIIQNEIEGAKILDLFAGSGGIGIEAISRGARKAYFVEKVLELENVKINGLTGKDSAPHVVSLSVRGVRSEVLLHALEEKGIYVSSGSACASNHPAISGVLKGIGANVEYLDATLRFSFSEFTTKEEIDYTLETLYNCVPMLRKYTRH